jgi:putative spermidine/putrescine transport system substrate-binding protein
MRKMMLRRDWLKGAGATVLAARLSKPALAQTDTLIKGTGEVVVASTGGSFEDAQRKAIFEPFQKDSGISVKIVAYTGPSQVLAQEKSGNVEWDIIMVSLGTMLALLKQNALAKIDYDKIEKVELDGMQKPLAPHAFGVPYILFSRVIAWNTKLVAGDHHPTSWMEVWDTAKFPGRRSFGGFSGSLTPDLEFALLADGVGIDALYPLDVDRAFKSLDRIRLSVDKFWTTGAQIPQMLSDAEVAVCSAYNNRIGDVIANGAPIGYDWNEGELQNNYLCILKDAKNYENAMKFIAYSSRGVVQAALSKETLLGPPNVRAFNYLAPERAKLLPTAPANVSKQFVYNDEWWGDHRDEIQKRWDQWALAK